MYRVKNTPVTSGSQCKDGSTVRLLDRQPSDYRDFTTSPHPHGLVPFRQRHRIRYRDDLTGIIPAGISLSFSSSVWPPRGMRLVHRHQRRMLRAVLEGSPW